MTLRKVPNLKKKESTLELIPLPRRRSKYSKEKNDMPKIRAFLHLMLFFFSWLLTFSVPKNHQYGTLSLLTIAISSIMEFSLKLKKMREVPFSVRELIKKTALTLRCYSVAFLNAELYLQYGDSIEITNLCLILPAMFVYWTVWRASNNLYIELYFPFTCLVIMYSCFLTSNTFGALAAMANAWAYYIRVNFKVIKDVVHSIDIYNVVMCFYVWFAFEGIVYTPLINE